MQKLTINRVVYINIDIIGWWCYYLSHHYDPFSQWNPVFCRIWFLALVLKDYCPQTGFCKKQDHGSCKQEMSLKCLKKKVMYAIYIHKKFHCQCVAISKTHVEFHFKFGYIDGSHRTSSNIFFWNLVGWRLKLHIKKTLVLQN